MFKTIHECAVHLISHSVSTDHRTFTGIGELEAFASEVGDWSMDFMPCSSARVSFGNEDKTGQNVEADKKLMKYLAEHQHMTPFEYQHATFLVEVPLFIRSQIHRHRAFSYNEISRRYTSEDLEFWVPDAWRGQSKSNRQASDGLVDAQDWSSSVYRTLATSSLAAYEELVKQGVAREQARATLPQALLTKFYMGGNLRSWAHFIALRRDPHAQMEVQVVAERIAAKLKELWPNSCEALGI